MPGQQSAGRPNRLDQRLGEVFPEKMFPHSIDQILPECFSTCPVHAFVSDYRELLHARRDENQHAVAFARLVHPELDEFPTGALQNVFFEFSALKEHADLAGRLGFRRFDRADDSIVLEFANEIMGAHPDYQLPLDPPPPKLPPPPLNPLKPPPDEDEDDQPPDEPPPQPLLTNGPPNPV